MPKPYPHGRSADGRDYVCEQCGAKLPDGVLVEGHWTDAGKLTGVRATTLDGEVLHTCGTKVSGGKAGQHG